MRAILIDPTTRTICEVDYNGDYKTIATTLGCSIYTVMHVGNGVDMFLDDEGLLTYPNPHGYFKMRGYDGILAGKALITGTDMEGNTIACPPWVNVDETRRIVSFIDTPSAEEVEPRFEILTGDDALAAMGLK